MMIAGFAILTLSFQNCSRASFQVDEAALEKAAGSRDPGDDGQRPDGSGGNLGDDGNRPGKNPGGNIPGGSVPGGNDPAREICEGNLRPPANRTPVALCPAAKTVRLMAGQHHYVGDVSIAAKDDLLQIKISLLSSVSMTETHVDVASSPEALQVSPGQFRYHGNHSPAISGLTYQIPLSDLNLTVGQTIYARVHAVVQPVAGQPEQAVCGGETAWAEGIRDGIGWSMYVPLTLAECP